MSDRARRVLLVFWIGSLWTIGFVVAPTLFRVLDDPSIAGGLAATFFAFATWLSMLAAPLWWWLAGPARTSSRWLAVTVALILMVMHFGVAPFMQSVSWGHSAAAALYFAACAAGLGLVLRDRRQAG